MNALNLTVGAAIQARKGALVEKIVERHYATKSNDWRKRGAAGLEKSRRDVGYHLDYLSQAIHAASPGLFFHYLAWAKVLFANLKLPADTLETSLRLMGDVLLEELEGEAGDFAVEFIRSGLQKLPELPASIPSFISSSQPLGALAHAYLDALLRRDRQQASWLVMEAIESGVSVRDIYLHVFQRSQQEIGRLWQIQQISVAHEHYCTAATQMIMSQLYPYIFGGERNGYRVVAACVGEELHELGLRMVADFFELDGWDTVYLGANTPREAVIDSLLEARPQLLCLSTTISFHLPRMRELIAAVRAVPGLQDLPIIVGGYPFNADTTLWQSVGADGYASDALQAVELGGRLAGRGV